jgi:hypothetical protein
MGKFDAGGYRRRKPVLPGTLGYAGTEHGIREPMAVTHPWRHPFNPTPERIPPEKLRRPLPMELVLFEGFYREVMPWLFEDQTGDGN